MLGRLGVDAFRFDAGEAASIESGSLASWFRRVGALRLGDWRRVDYLHDSSAEEARGVECSDSMSGHGFEASRVSSRQEASDVDLGCVRAGAGARADCRR